MIANWVSEANAQPLIQMLSLLVGYDWDSMDSDALVAGVAASNAETGQWSTTRGALQEGSLPLDQFLASLRGRVEQGAGTGS